jgi:hypothetical protein
MYSEPCEGFITAQTASSPEGHVSHVLFTGMDDWAKLRMQVIKGATAHFKVIYKKAVRRV